MKFGRQLDSDHIPLQHFFIVLEHVLRHGVRPKKVIMTLSRDASSDNLCSGIVGAQEGVVGPAPEDREARPRGLGHHGECAGPAHCEDGRGPGPGLAEAGADAGESLVNISSAIPPLPYSWLRMISFDRPVSCFTFIPDRH